MGGGTGEDILKIAAIGGLAATGLGVAGIGPLAGALGGSAASTAGLGLGAGALGNAALAPELGAAGTLSGGAALGAGGGLGLAAPTGAALGGGAALGSGAALTPTAGALGGGLGLTAPIGGASALYSGTPAAATGLTPQMAMTAAQLVKPQQQPQMQRPPMAPPIQSGQGGGGSFAQSSPFMQPWWQNVKG